MGSRIFFSYCRESTAHNFTSGSVLHADSEYITSFSRFASVIELFKFFDFSSNIEMVGFGTDRFFLLLIFLTFSG